MLLTNIIFGEGIITLRSAIKAHKKRTGKQHRSLKEEEGGREGEREGGKERGREGGRKRGGRGQEVYVN